MYFYNTAAECIPEAFSQPKKEKYFSLRASIWYNLSPVIVCVQKGDPLLSFPPLFSPLLSSCHLHTVSTGLFPATSSVIWTSCGLAAPHRQQLAAWPPGRGPPAAGRVLRRPARSSVSCEGRGSRGRHHARWPRSFLFRAAQCNAADCRFVLISFLTIFLMLQSDFKNPFLFLESESDAFHQSITSLDSLTH